MEACKSGLQRNFKEITQLQPTETLMNKNDVFKMSFLYNYDLLLYISVAPKTHSCNLIEYIFPTFLVFFSFVRDIGGAIFLSIMLSIMLSISSIKRTHLWREIQGRLVAVAGRYWAATSYDVNNKGPAVRHG